MTGFGERLLELIDDERKLQKVGSPPEKRSRCLCKEVQRRSTLRAVEESLVILGDALRYYGAGRLIAAFNGGKDSLVVTVLMLVAIAESKRKREGGSPDSDERPAHAAYFRCPTTKHFPEIDEYVSEISSLLGISVETYHCDYVEGIGKVLDQHKTEHTSSSGVAFILGVREGDSKGRQPLMFSSDWLPSFMRVHAIMHWTYGDVWDFITWMKLPYCPLYDQGYTSMGRADATAPNEALRIGEKQFLPAWALMEPNWNLERWGRPVIQSSDGSSSPPEETPMSESDGNLHCEENYCATQNAWRLHVFNAKSAGILIIGNEVLKGRVHDVNTPHAIAEFNKIGVEVKQVITCRDDMDDIIAGLNNLRKTCDLVITSGGVGSTHDDITVEAISAALGQKTYSPPWRVERFERFGGVVATKLASVPEMADFRVPRDPSHRDTFWKIVQCHNIFILPGIPEVFRGKLETICGSLVRKKSSLHFRRIKLCCNEESIAERLTEIVKLVADQIEIGSYPIWDGQKSTNPKAIRTIITIDGNEEKLVEESVKLVTECFSEDEILSVDKERSVSVPL